MKLLKEPLIHFAVAGIGLFLAYGWLNGDGGANGSAEIRITDGQLRWVTETWSNQWRRRPSDDELRGLVAELVKEEMLAREARALGLDQDDTIIRRRLAQKMTFLIEDTAPIAEPSEEDLRQFYNAHPDRFRREARLSFDHVFFSTSKRSDAAADARSVLAASDALDDAEMIDRGDPLLFASRLGDSTEADIAAQFGAGFAQRLVTLPSGKWSGPIESAYGLHLVRLSETAPAAIKPFAEVKADVIEQWRDKQRRDYERRYFAELFGKYDIAADAGAEPLVSALPRPTEDVR
ncbi:peptidyl-prolyl cis-trans isomerase [Ensifer sp. BR816]|uniref:peptidylprolyl isomerase n=1 Tax=Rhizobium sp. (strain BR816) TaxID=1057002 RepID=UPI00037B9EAE|nr:peptidylprolyl isomerase [Ensifer sp. BR816]